MLATHHRKCAVVQELDTATRPLIQSWSVGLVDTIGNNSGAFWLQTRKRCIATAITTPPIAGKVLQQLPDAANSALYTVSRYCGGLTMHCRNCGGLD